MGHILLNEHLADKEVIRNLRREIARMKGSCTMAKITLFKDTDGQIKQAQQFEVVSRQEIQDAIKECELSLESLKQALVDFDNYAATEPDTETAAPVAEVPAQVQAPVDVPAPVEQPTPVADPTPVAQPTPITIQ
jgi:cell division septum initiation protein DivIVA